MIIESKTSTKSFEYINHRIIKKERKFNFKIIKKKNIQTCHAEWIIIEQDKSTIPRFWKLTQKVWLETGHNKRVNLNIISNQVRVGTRYANTSDKRTVSSRTLCWICTKSSDFDPRLENLTFHSMMHTCRWASVSRSLAPWTVQMLTILRHIDGHHPCGQVSTRQTIAVGHL